MFGSQPRRKARLLSLTFWLCSTLGAAPQLSTIQDVLYKADGTRFNGTVFIEWNSFEAADASTIATHSVAAPIIDGNLRVQLVPTTNASGGAYYHVRYNSDGRIQFEETWAVAPSATALRLKDVRVSSLPDTSGPPPPVNTEVQLSDVVGLMAELAMRPLKGPLYLNGRAAVINAQGELEAVAGVATDCVRVDGTSGPCGTSASSFADAEVPAGTINGVNAAFTAASAPNPASSLALYRNGVLQKQGLDYTVSGSAITFASGSIPQTGDTLLASYRIGGAGPLMGELPLAATPQVLCATTGAMTSASTATSLGSCLVPGGTLAEGDRVEIRYDYAHQGSATGFTFEVRWGATTLVARAAGASESMVTGRGDAAVHSGGAQWNMQSWGGTVGFTVGIGNASDLVSADLTVGFLGRMAGPTGDMVALRNYTVVRYPAQARP